MESLFLLIPVSLVFLGIAVAILFWAVNSGQYDDIDREGERILFDEDTPARPVRSPGPGKREAKEGEGNG